MGYSVDFSKGDHVEGKLDIGRSLIDDIAINALTPIVIPLITAC